MKSGFTIKKVTVENGGFTYDTFHLRGWLNSQRIRKQFKSREEALGEKNRLEVRAANAEGGIAARNTRLTDAQLREAEAAFTRLGVRPLSLAVDWFLQTYQAPTSDVTIKAAGEAFLAERAQHVRHRQLRDYKAALRDLEAAFAGRYVHSITTADIQAFLTARKVGPKRWNNLRGDLHGFFAFCVLAPRQWIRANPVTPIPAYRITRGVPEILTAAKAVELMAYVERYDGGPKAKHRPGYLAGYFALCLFAGIRPSVLDGEIRKLAEARDITKYIKPDLGVIQITPEVSKVRAVRQIKIRPGLAEWLRRFPINEYPIIAPNMDKAVGKIRKMFGLSGDVMRHTFISMHVAKWKSVGEAALEAGNSEAMIKKHYLNMVSEADANLFWSIWPTVEATTAAA